MDHKPEPYSELSANCSTDGGSGKLAFFVPADRKYIFKVMPFGATNAPSFYTAIMSDFKDKWDKLFILRLMALNTMNDK